MKTKKMLRLYIAGYVGNDRHVLFRDEDIIWIFLPKTLYSLRMGFLI